MIQAIAGPLGAKLSERWVSQIVVPGLLYVAIATVAIVLGHHGWYDLGAIERWIDDVAARPAFSTPGGIGLTMAWVLVATHGTGLAARGLGDAILRLWLGVWPPPLDRLARLGTERRRRRWNRWQQRFEASALADPPRAGVARQVARARNRIATAEPRRPTWIGDRLTAVETRVVNAYGLDLASCWPRMWLVVPESTRSAILASRADVGAAATLAGWAALYLALGAAWWPAAVIAAVIWLLAVRAGRNTVAVLADLIESTVDVHAAILARSVGLDCPGALSPALGQELTRRFRKGA